MITVMLSSCNGGERLRRTLESMTRAREPVGGWRLIAVDNCSTDDSHTIMTSYSGVLPITVLQEAVPGKNRALNRALEEAIKNASSDLFVFCDDDVLVSEDWLLGWRAVADDQPDYTAFAGLTLPHWPFGPPEWIPRLVNTTIVYATHADMHEGPCDMRCMHGTNMAVRASEFRNGCRFNPNIGPNGSATYAMGSETDLALRLEALGCECWFAERPAVYHIIRRDQLEKDWILNRGYRFGRGTGLMGESHNMSLSPGKLSVKNRVKAFVYPWLLPLLSLEEAWKRQWQWAYDCGYEDGALERLGKPRLWLNAGRISICQSGQMARYNVPSKGLT